MHVVCEDGPAREAGLSGMERLPVFLRVVQDADSGKWDVLDALEDVPKPSEQIHVYRGRGIGHVRGATRSESGPVGFYAHVPGAPAADLRETAAWRAWCQSQGKPRKPRKLLRHLSRRWTEWMEPDGSISHVGDFT